MVHMTKWQDIYTDMHLNDSHKITLQLKGNPKSYNEMVIGKYNVSVPHFQ